MLVWGAIGDAWGSWVEGKSADAPSDLPVGSRITDDTQLTLATVRATLDTKQPDPESIAGEFKVLFSSGRLRGLGSSTLKALIELRAGGHWALVGAKGERAAGNGAAMRVAPLLPHVDLSEFDDRRLVRDVCRITHHNEEAYVGALALLRALFAIESANLDSLCGRVASQIPDSAVRDGLMALDAMDPLEELKVVAEQFGNSGYVAESVPFAIYSVQRLGSRSSVAELLAEVVKAGGDADTNASMAGQLAGFARPDESWSDLASRLEENDEIVSLAESFAHSFGASSRSPNRARSGCERIDDLL